MRYEGHRFMLYKRGDYAPHGRTKEQQEALDAGQAYSRLRISNIGRASWSLSSVSKLSL
jgi:hypothetical protein